MEREARPTVRPLATAKGGEMQPIPGSHWRQTLRKIVSNPAIEVVAAIVVVLVASSVLILSEAENRHTVFPVPVLAR